MKKILSILIACLFLCAVPGTCEEAAGVNAFVSITDETASIALAYAPVSVTDLDADGVCSIADALACAHIQYHSLGAEAFVCEETEYGISLLKLWNIDNGGSFGYCLNDASAMSLADPVSEGDHIKAYAYTDLDTWSDTYCYFAVPSVSVSVGEEVSSVLTASGFDASWAPITFPVPGAVITVNGERTEVITGEDASFTLSFTEPGLYIVSAVSEEMTLVPPVLTVNVTAE